MAITGKFEADFASFRTAVEGAELQLKSFESGGVKVADQMNRVADSLSGRKLIQDATLAAEAVDRIGGVSKLTERELARLSTQANEAAAKLRAMGQDVPENIQRIGDAARKTGGFVNDLTSQVKATALGFISAQAVMGVAQAGFRDLTEFVGGSIDSYASAEAAAKKMTVALENQGTATPAVVGQFNDLASTIQHTTVNSDDLANQMEALLTQVGNVAPREMNKALTASTDLAAGLGIDLQSATTLVAKAFEGNISALKRYGIEVDESRFRTEGATVALAAIQARFGGQAQAELETYAGKLKQIANNWDNVKEAVGGAIVNDELVTAVLRHADDAAREAGDGATALSAAWDAVVPLAPEWVRALDNLRRDLEPLAAVENAAADAATRMNAVKPPAAFQILPGLVDQLDAESKAMTDVTTQIGLYNAQLAETQKAYAGLSTEERAAIAGALDLGIAHEKIESAFRVTPELIALITKARQEDAAAETKAHADEIKNIADRNRKFTESAAIIDGLIADTFAQQAKYGGTAQDQERARILDTEQREIASLRRRGLSEQEFATAASLIHQLAKRDLEGLGADWDLVGASSARAGAQAIEAAQKTLNALVLAGAPRDVIQKQIDTVRELTQAWERAGQATSDAEQKGTAATDRHNEALQRQLDLVQAAIAAQGQSMQSTLFGSGPLDDKNKTVHTLGGEWITPAEAKKRFDSGGDRDYSDPANLNRPAMSVEDFIRAFGNNIDAGAAAYNADQAARARGRAALSLSSTIPLSGGGRGDTHVTVPVSVNGVLDPVTIRDLSDKVASAVMGKLTIGRQLSYG